MKTSAILAAVALATTVAATAPANADWIDDRQARQMQRIEHGWRNGQLTRQEYYRLVEQQREIARLEHLLERDGRLSYADRAYLTQLQNEASRSIAWEKHDAQTQYNQHRPNQGWGNGGGWGWGWNNRNYGNGRDYGYGYGRGHRDHGYGHAPRRWYQWY